MESKLIGYDKLKTGLDIISSDYGLGDPRWKLVVGDYDAKQILEEVYHDHKIIISRRTGGTGPESLDHEIVSMGHYLNGITGDTCCCSVTISHKFLIKPVSKRNKKVLVVVGSECVKKFRHTFDISDCSSCSICKDPSSISNRVQPFVCNFCKS